MVPNRYIDNCGSTPLVAVQIDPARPRIWCKLEYFNPSGSTKDRIAGYILGKALRRGDIHPGDWVVEASSGSTSIAMALACAQLNLQFLAVMPEGVSSERSLMIRALGGEVVFSPADKGIHGALDLARREAPSRRAFLPQQFSNPDNAAAHRFHTCREIMAQLCGQSVDAVVSGVGTGGTLVGLFKGCLDYGCTPRPFAARPVGHSYREVECTSFSTRIPGVVEGLSTVYNTANLPGLKELDVDDDDALDCTRRLIAMGFPVGPSSGLNYWAAQRAVQDLPAGAVVVTVFPDRMERYFSTELFSGLK